MKKENESIGILLKQKDFHLVILSSFLLSFTFFFGAIDFTIISSESIWFDVYNIVGFSFIVLLVMFFILSGIGMALKNTLRQLYGGILFGLSVALHIQGNFLNQNLNALIGSVQGFSNEEILFNSFFWLMILSIAVFMIRKGKGREIAKYAMIVLALVQCTTLGIELISYKSDENEQTRVLTVDDMNQIGDENIIVLLADMLDQEYIEKLLNDDPDYFDDYEGFTYYRNCTGLYSSTHPTICYLLTGQEYHMETTLTDYREQAYSNPELYLNRLSEEYEIDVYTASTYVDHAEPGLISNQAASDSLSAKGFLEPAATWYKVVLYRYLPLGLKNAITLNSKDYDVLKRQYNLEGVYNLTNEAQVDFFNRIEQEGLKNNKNKLFKFIHLWGTHIPFSIDENVQVADDGDVTYLETSKGVFNIMKAYLENLKNAGVYDNSTIILMSDHGVYNYNVTNPFLFVKPSNSSDAFSVSDVPVSFRDIIPTIMSAAHMNSDNTYGSPLWEMGFETKRDREFYYFFQEDQPVYGINSREQIEFLAPNETNNPQLFTATGNLYTLDGVVPLSSYQLVEKNQKLSFLQMENRKLFDYGVCTSSGSDAFSWGRNSQMSFEVNAWDGGDLRCAIEARPVIGEQSVIVKTGETVLYEALADGAIEFTVPEKFIHDGKVVLKFEYPEAQFGRTDFDPENVFVVAVVFDSFELSEIQN